MRAIWLPNVSWEIEKRNGKITRRWQALAKSVESRRVRRTVASARKNLFLYPNLLTHFFWFIFLIGVFRKIKKSKWCQKSNNWNILKIEKFEWPGNLKIGICREFQKWYIEDLKIGICREFENWNMRKNWKLEYVKIKKWEYPRKIKNWNMPKIRKSEYAENLKIGISGKF